MNDIIVISILIAQLFSLSGFYNVEGIQDIVYDKRFVIKKIEDSNIFDDIEDFLNMKIVGSPRETWEKFERMLRHESNESYAIRRFIDANFVNGQGLEKCVPDDWKGRPSVVDAVNDIRTKSLIRGSNFLFASNCRRLDRDVHKNGDLYSFLIVPHAFFLSSNRGEMNAKDSYGVFQALIALEMYNSARLLLENLFELIKKRGYVPLRNRKYETRGSLPLLAPMVEEYFLTTGDIEFVKWNIQYLDREFLFWLEKSGAILDCPFGNVLVMTDEQKKPRREKFIWCLSPKHQASMKMSRIFWRINSLFQDETPTRISSSLTAAMFWSADSLMRLHFVLEPRNNESHFSNYRTLSKDLRRTLKNVLNFRGIWYDLELEYGWERQHGHPAWSVKVPHDIVQLLPPYFNIHSGVSVVNRELSVSSFLSKLRMTDKSIQQAAVALHLIRRFPNVTLIPEDSPEPKKNIPFHWIIEHLLKLIILYLSFVI